MLPPLLDAPAPTPEVLGYTARRALPPLVAQKSRLALPAPTVPVAEAKRWSGHPLSGWVHPKRLSNLDRARGAGKHLQGGPCRGHRQLTLLEQFHPQIKAGSRARPCASSTARGFSGSSLGPRSLANTFEDLVSGAVIGPGWEE